MIFGPRLCWCPWRHCDLSRVWCRAFRRSRLGCRRALFPPMRLPRLLEDQSLRSRRRAPRQSWHRCLTGPRTGHLENATFAGSEPFNLALSTDGTYAYTYLSGTGGMLARIHLSSSTRDLMFSADPTGQGQQVAVNDLCVGPDGGLAFSYAGGTIAIYDQAVPRPQVDYNRDNLAESDAEYQLRRRRYVRYQTLRL